MDYKEIYDKMQVGDSIIYNPSQNRIFWFMIERVHGNYFTVGVIENKPRWYGCSFLKCPGDVYALYKVKEECRRV